MRSRAPAGYAFGTVTASGNRQAGRLDAVVPGYTTVVFTAPASGAGKDDRPPIKSDGASTITGGNTTVSGGKTSVTGGNTTVSGGSVSASAGVVVNVGPGAILNISAGPASASLPTGPNFLQIAAARWYEAASVQRLTLAARATAMVFDGRCLWAALAQTSKLARIDPSSGAVDEITLASLSALKPAPTLTDVGAMVHDGEKFWVSTMQGYLAVRRDGSLPLLGPGIVAGELALFDGDSVWLSMGDGLLKVDALTGSVRASVPLQSHVEGIAFDGRLIWATSDVPNSGTLTGVRASDAQVESRQSLGFRPGPVAYDGENLWIADPDNDAVQRWRYDATTGACAASGRFAVGDDPRAVLFDGANVWVANWAGSSVTKLRAIDGAVLGTASTDPHPQALAFDGINTWVACDQGVVQRL